MKESRHLQSWLRVAGGLLAAALGATLLMGLALWLFYRSGDPLVAPTVTLSGADLHLTSGEGRRTPEGIEIRRPGSDGILMVQGAMRALEAERYGHLSWELEGLTQEQKLRFVWATAAHPGTPRVRALPAVTQGTVRLDPSTESDWKGQIVAVGLALMGPLQTPILIRRIQLEPRSPTPLMLVKALAEDWMHRDGWTGRSINFHRDAPRNALFPPVLLVAIWIGLGTLLYALVNPPWRGFRTPTPYALLWLLGWLALDLRWQSDLSERLRLTQTRYAGLDTSARHLAGPDRDLFPFLQEVRRLLRPMPARVFIIGSDPNAYAVGRARYHLLPHNAHLGLSALPERSQVRAGDYLLILSPSRKVRYDRERRLLISGQTRLTATLVHALTAQGALFRVEEGA